MKASELIKKIQERIKDYGDLDVGIVKVEGGNVHEAMDVTEVSTDGECCIYLEYRVIECPKCHEIWGTTDRHNVNTLQMCKECSGIKSFDDEE